MNKSNKKIAWFEQIFEAFLWGSRFITLLSVLCGLGASLTLFIIGSNEILHTILEQLHTIQEMNYEHALIGIIGAIDLYLIAIVLLIFSFGIYELFISKIDIAREDQDPHILEIHSLDELKSKILQVIIMVLIVSFFKSVLSTKFQTPMELLYLAISILALAWGVFLIRSHSNKKTQAE